MTIGVGDKIPLATVTVVGPDGLAPMTTDEIFSGKKVVLFALPELLTEKAVLAALDRAAGAAAAPAR